jgi:hypothetical protein
MNKLFEDLFKPFPDAVKETKTVQGTKATYVSWIHYVARAHNTFPEGYSKSLVVNNVRGFQYDKKTGAEVEVNTLVVTCRITDNRSGAYQEALGSADAGKTSWGGAVTEAESQAMRRAFANWGLGLEMYMDDAEFERTVGARNAAEGNPDVDAKPPASNPELDGPPASARQHEVLKAIGKVLGEAGEEEFLKAQRDFLSHGMTVARAGMAVKRFREKLAELGYEDPTKEGEPS